MQSSIVISGIILLVSMVIPLLFYYLHKHSTHELEVSERSLLATNLGFFNALYAFLLGFAVVTLWTQFIKSGDLVIKEATTINNLYRLSLVIPGGEDMRSAILRYNKSVIDDEWPEMDKYNKMSPRTQEIFQEIWFRAHKLKPISDESKLFYSQLVEQLQKLAECRLQRILLIDGHLYPLIWFIIIAGAILAIISFYYISIEKLKIQFIFDSILICMMFLTIWLIAELNTPFSGNVNVTSKPFVITREHLSTVNATLEHFELQDREKEKRENQAIRHHTPAPGTTPARIKEELAPFR
jgi:hypothetical protein